jgi:hypothetical protein
LPLPFKALALSICLSSVGQAQQPLEVRRGDIQVKARVSGTVVTEDIVRLKSAIDGRVEDLSASSWTWVTADTPLGYLANKEMAAILDSHNTTEKGVLEERWKKVYQPTPIQCPSDCFILRKYIKEKEWLKPKAILFEAALKLQAVGRVRPEDAGYVKDGQVLEFWALNDPSHKLKARIAHYVLDFQGNKFEPGGSFTIDLSAGRYLPPGTEWEGLVIPVTKKNVLMVPTDALIKYEGSVYLPVRVSTGITTRELTEITAGTEQKRPILVLDDARLNQAMRHKAEIDPDLIKKRIADEYLKDNPKPKKDDAIEPLRDPDSQDYGEDPYAQ